MGLRKQRASDNSQMSATNTAGSKYLVPNSRVRVSEPEWNKGFPTTVKILPAYDPETKKFLPYRSSVDESPTQLTDWRMVLPIIKWVGTSKNNKLSCILYDPAAARAQEYDPDNNPYIIMRQAVESASKEDKETKVMGRMINTSTWLRYFKGDLATQAFSRPQMAAFMQVIFYTSRGKLAFNDDGIPRGLAPDDSPQLLLLTETANGSLESKLCETTTAHRTDGKLSDIDKMFKYGDVTRLDKGKFMIICNPKQEDDHLYSRVTGVEAHDDLLPDRTGKKDGFATYEMEFFDKIKLRAKGRKAEDILPDLSDHEKHIKANMVDWFSDSTFRVMSDEELAVEVTKSFASRLELVDYGWREAPQYRKLAEVQAIFTNRTQGFVPGAADDSDEDSDEDDGDTLGTRASDDDDDDDSGSSKRKRRLKGSTVYDKLKTDYDEDSEDSDQKEEEEEKPVRRVVRKGVAKKTTKKVVRRAKRKS